MKTPTESFADRLRRESSAILASGEPATLCDAFGAPAYPLARAVTIVTAAALTASAHRRR